MTKLDSNLVYAERPQKTGEKISVMGRLLFVFTVMSLLAFWRGSASFAFPYIYAEDGVWLGDIMNHGFLNYAFQGRADFPVFGLIVLESLSLAINHLLFGADISPLPQVVSVVSALFIGFVATLPFATMRSRLHPFFCLMMSLCIILLPVGNDGFEIFGRILNLGFYMPVVAQFCLFVLLYKKPSQAETVFLHIGMLVLMWTFPVVIAQYLLFVVFYIVQRKGRGVLVTLVCFAAVLFLAVVKMQFLAITGAGGIPLPFKNGSLVEFVFARSIMFPVIAAFYSAMSNDRVIGIFFALVAALIWAVWPLDRKRFDITDYRVFFFLNFGLMLVATLVMRRGLTSLLSGYTTSFPDRYYTGLNILFLLVMIVVTGSSANRAVRKFAATGFVVMIASWILLAPTFEKATSQEFGTFRDMLCARGKSEAGQPTAAKEDPVVLKTYPTRWEMKIPRDVFNETIRRQCPAGGPAIS